MIVSKNITVSRYHRGAKTRGKPARLLSVLLVFLWVSFRFSGRFWASFDFYQLTNMHIDHCMTNIKQLLKIEEMTKQNKPNERKNVLQNLCTIAFAHLSV